MTKVNDHVTQGSPDPNIITLGVTGHRYLRDIDELIPHVDAVLDQIEAQWPGASLTVVSSLAEGSDRLVVERVLRRRRTRLIVPLPMEEEIYMRDFMLPESQRQFLGLLAQADEIVHFPPLPSRPAAYEQAGRYMLEQSDLLIALWDGHPAQGDGGTGSVVAWARQCGMPLAWIHACNCRPGTPPSTPLSPQGTVTLEQFATLLDLKE
jgi:hypothetical protein